MKKLLLITAALAALNVQAQVTPELKVLKKFTLPRGLSGSLAANDSGSVAYYGGQLYKWNGSSWSAVNGGSGSTDNLRWYNMAANGADTTGVVSCSSIAQSAINAGFKVLYFGKGKYLVTTTIQLKDSVTIIGDSRTTTIIKTTSNQPVFKCSNALGGHNAQFANFTLQGNIGTGTTAQEGVTIDSCYGVNITNVGGYNMAGWLFHIKKNALFGGNYIVDATKGNTINNCYGIGNYGGANLDTSAEYNGVTNCNFTNGTYSVFLAGGNCRIIGNNLSGNDYGLYQTGGANNAHGLVEGNLMQHCRYNLYLTGVTAGMSYVNNCFGRARSGADGLIEIIDCINLKFVGGYFITGDTIRVTNSSKVSFVDQYYHVGNPTVVVVSGEAPTFAGAGYTNKSYSLMDFPNGKRMDITHNNNAVNFTGTSGINYGVNKAAPNYGFDINRGVGLNKDSIPIGYSSRWKLVIDTVTGQVKRDTTSSGSTYTAGYGLGLSSTTFTADSSVLLTKGSTQVISGSKTFTAAINSNSNITTSADFVGGTGSKLYFGTTSTDVYIYKLGTQRLGVSCAGCGQAGLTAGSVEVTSGGYFGVNGRAGIQSPSDGILRLLNWNFDNFTMLQLGGGTSSFPGIVRNGAGVDIKLADNSGFANLTVNKYYVSAMNTAPSSASDTGTTGEIRITATYIYVCTATNTWVRTALASW